MILISVSSAADALGVSCNTANPKETDQLLEQLRLVTPRAAAALECETLEHGKFKDAYMLGLYASCQQPGVVHLRTTNGFLRDDAEILIEGLYDAEGNPAEPLVVNHRDGFVVVPYETSDKIVSITYESGFKIPEDSGPDDGIPANPGHRLAIDVPTALQGIVFDLFVQHRRNALQIPKNVAENISLHDLNVAILQDLRARLRNWYMRPRHKMTFPDVYQKVA